MNETKRNHSHTVTEGTPVRRLARVNRLGEELFRQAEARRRREGEGKRRAKVKVFSCNIEDLHELKLNPSLKTLYL